MTYVHRKPTILVQKDAKHATVTASVLLITFATLPLVSVNAEQIHMVENVINVELDFGISLTAKDVIVTVTQIFVKHEQEFALIVRTIPLVIIVTIAPKDFMVIQG